jgi:hypothetical protein
MLNDSQIERYSRQILLPQVGGRGQERLFDAVVAIRGGGDAMLACASYLCSAGVGRLWVGAIGTVGAAGLALAGGRTPVVEAIGDRNPDCRLLEAFPERPSLVVSIAPTLPHGDSTAAALLWGGASEECVACVSVPAGGCLECARAAATAEGCRGSSALLGTVLALQALRVLLGFAENDRPDILRFDVSRVHATRSPLSRRPDCGTCAGNAPASPHD